MGENDRGSKGLDKAAMEWWLRLGSILEDFLLFYAILGLLALTKYIVLHLQLDNESTSNILLLIHSGTVLVSYTMLAIASVLKLAQSTITLIRDILPQFGQKQRQGQ